MTSSIMAEERDLIVEFHDPSETERSQWLPTCILGLEPFGDHEEDDYQLFSKRRSVFSDGLEMEACGEDDRRFCFTGNMVFEWNNNYKYRHQPHSGRKLPDTAQPPLLPSPPHWKNYSKPDKKSKYPTNWAAGGPGMQAVFLASGQRSCGTGVFLPRTAGTDAEKPRKPAFAPILLPSRVVQALNLNIHGLGLQIKPREHNNNVKRFECDRIRSKNRDMSGQTCVVSQNRSSSPEIFLPKEWTY